MLVNLRDICAIAEQNNVFQKLIFLIGLKIKLKKHVVLRI